MDVMYLLCPCVSVKAVYSELHNTLMSISEQDDLKWWKNNHGPGMPTDWPKINVSYKVILQYIEGKVAISSQINIIVFLVVLVFFFFLPKKYMVSHTV